MTYERNLKSKLKMPPKNLIQSTPRRNLPALNERNTFFWQSGKDGVLRIIQCRSCNYFLHPAGPICPKCHSREVSPTKVSGQAVVATFTINRQVWHAGLENPYIVAIVKKLKTNKILRIPGAYNPLTAKLIEEIGYDAVYVSGGVMANDLGFPDIGLTTLEDVSTRAYLISREPQLISLSNIPSPNLLYFYKFIPLYFRIELRTL